VEWAHILFFSNEGNPLDPCHIHGRKGERIAKFLVEPDVCLASSYQMTAKELNILEKIVMENTNLIRR